MKGAFLGNRFLREHEEDFLIQTQGEVKGCCCVGWNSSVDGSFSYKGRVADEESLSSKRATD